MPGHMTKKCRNFTDKQTKLHELTFVVTKANKNLPEPVRFAHMVVHIVE